ncbi:2-oxoacid:acceptor oxidoreductase subunit alpha [Paludibacter sp. 221]|uniref:2-oxoacid:acceptor oxidoreductase subunit alpha n=1 Tax=Paludibacter sp. 221 TaxID=2302939 RepID=UPI0013D26C69|nr:2-oxoacid:acceptor oxidoreductase subunit alpha [Paludibacter sp. 221]NDV45649.1 2-oxoacid:acceptor oxidoreductase subunit alpha [Paludibacter sp. 221]
MEKENSTELEQVVIRFSGDSGDGMQLTGTLFSNISAILGNEISTFPDYPAEIRAPQGTIGGVSGFQVHLGSGKIYTPGDEADVLVAMNPAALKVNAKGVKKGGVIIYDVDSFEKSDLEKALFVTENPFEELGLSDTIQLVPVQLTSLTQESLKDSGLDNKSIVRSKNMFALGLVCWLFNRPMDQAIHFLEDKFKKKPAILEANIKVLTDGFNYGNNLHLSISTFVIDKSHDVKKGRYTSICGNTSAAFGLIAAAEKAGMQLFLGSYPITPATDVMHELAYRKDLGVKVVQAEDEIAGITTAIGAAFAGSLAATNTSGPGLALKSEAIGLAVMAELPLVIIDVQRSGPSTGMPTKTEQTDLLQALYGRNGESPVVVLAASTPANCFHYAYMASKIALEHMTPVILLTDAFIGNGTSLWKLPKLAELPEIKPHYVQEGMQGCKVTCRDEESKVRFWSFPSMEGFQHRNGGLEKDYEKGSISTDAANHEKMVNTRAEKVDYVANSIPDVEVVGDKDADLLVIGWGSTQGHLTSAVEKLNKSGKKAALAQFTYINPLPKNTADVIRKYKKVVVCELNSGQFATYLRSKVSGVEYLQYNKVQGQPFTVTELVEHFTTLA